MRGDDSAVIFNPFLFPAAVAALTLSNLEKHEQRTNQQEGKKRHKFDNIFSMDSPSTMQTPTGRKSAMQFEFPSATSPTEMKASLTAENADEANPEHINQQDIPSDNHLETPDARRRKRNDRKSISMETPIKLLEADEKIATNRRTSDVYRDLILEDKINALQKRKYSVLASDGSVKNFVSENSKEMKKAAVGGGEKGASAKKVTPGRRGSEVPQRHRRVSIVQGDSLRHFIFEEPDVSRNSKSSGSSSRNRKVSVVVENLDDLYNRKSSLVPGDTLRNLLGEPDRDRKLSIVPGEMARKFSINTLGKFSNTFIHTLLTPRIACW